MEAAPAEATRVRYWDRAATDGAGDFTAGVLLVRSVDGVFFVEDVVRGQWSSGVRDQIMKATAAQDAARYGERHRNAVEIVVEQEPGSSGKDSADAAVRMLAGYPVYVERATGAKDVRFEPFAAQAEAGNVRLVRGLWNGAYLEELTSFPTGTHDDQVDATAGGFNWLARNAMPNSNYAAPVPSGAMPAWRGELYGGHVPRMFA